MSPLFRLRATVSSRPLRRPAAAALSCLLAGLLAFQFTPEALGEARSEAVAGAQAVHAAPDQGDVAVPSEESSAGGSEAGGSESPSFDPIGRDGIVAGLPEKSNVVEAAASAVAGLRGGSSVTGEAAGFKDAASEGALNGVPSQAQPSSGAEAPAGSSDEAAGVSPQAVTNLLGRDFEGQAFKEINGQKYILIGNEQQLRAIGSEKKVAQRVYQVEQTLTNVGSTLLPKLEWVDSGAESVAYDGDADLATGATLHDADFADHDGGGILPGDTRTKYFVKDASGNRLDVTDGTFGPNTGLTYSSDAKYIVFRDVDASTNAANPADATWTPLMFSGTMLGAVSGQADVAGSLWGCIGADGVSVNDAAGRPTVSNVTVRQTGELDVTSHTGVGFFGTVSNKLDADDPLSGELTPAYVSNIALSHVDVSNESTTVKSDETLVSGLVEGIGKLLDATLVALLAPLLKLLGLGSVTDLLHTLLTGVLDIRKADPSTFATGAFAGRVVGKVTVSDCDVSDVRVSNVASMTGGFVGVVQGETQYGAVSNLAGGLVTVLEKILNVIPGLGLGDLIKLLLDGGILDAKSLVPVGYANAIVTGCGVSGFSSGVVIGNDSGSHAGGFAGSMIGTIAQQCYVNSANAYDVKAESYAGGFAGTLRNDEMKGALAELGVDLPSLAIPQSAVVDSAISSDVTVSAGSYAGGFAGAMADSYAVNDGLSGAVSVTATGVTDESNHTVAVAGGFAGVATIGWFSDLGAGEKKESSLLAGVSDVLKSLLASNPEKAQDLLSLVGLEESEILGAHMEGSISVSSANDYAGGMVGKGVGTIVADSDAAHVDGLTFWKHGKLSWDAADARSTSVAGLGSVSAAANYAGGIAGELQPATIASLVGDTLGLGSIAQQLGDGQFKMFEVSNVALQGAADGASVSAGGYYAGGAIGLATGGEANAVEVSNVRKVSALGDAGGFVGFSGPSNAVGAGGVSLLGLVKISGLLSVASYSAVAVRSSSVEGIASGMTVEATGRNDAGETNEYAAGGFFGRANSTKATEAHVRGLKSVSADSTHSDGAAGGFVGISTTGGLVDAVNGSDDSSVLEDLVSGGLVSIDSLVGAIPYLVPNYKNATASFVNGGSVSADIAGGFAGDFQSGKVNMFTDAELKDDPSLSAVKSAVEASPWGVVNVARVSGGAFAGGWGGKVTSGSLASAGEGGVSLLGKLGTVKVSDLLDVVQGYVPLVNRSGVHSDASTVESLSGAALEDPSNPGLAVSAYRIDASVPESGAAGGYIGYGSGVQVSSSDVTQLRHTAVEEPDDLEGVDGGAYFGAGSSYAVDGARYAGGYLGHMDVGSAASVGDGLTLLGASLSLQNVLDVVQAVVSTVEHSDVNGGVGGFAVRASGEYGDAREAIGDGGGFVGLLSGGHVQDSNAEVFSYVIGQVSAGGYAGQMEPGDVARVLGELNKDGQDSALAKLLRGLVNTNGSLASLLQDFVPTVRNSETTSIPCGGAVRAQASSDDATLRGMAGGYVGHNLGGHVWGDNNAPWASAASWVSDNDEFNHYAGAKRLAAAHRIRSVYGAEMAGGHTGFMEPADTAKTGGVSLLFGLVKVDNILGALQVAYPTEENAEVTGPVRGIDLATWNAWSSHIAVNGPYGQEFAGRFPIPKRRLTSSSPTTCTA